MFEICRLMAIIQDDSKLTVILPISHDQLKQDNNPHLLCFVLVQKYFAGT